MKVHLVKAARLQHHTTCLFVYQYFELVFPQLQLVKILCKLIII